MTRLSRDPGRQSSRRLTILLATIASAGAIALSGCGGTSVGQAAKTSTPVKGGTLSLVTGDPTTLDPAICWETAGWVVLHSVYETLYDYVPASGDAGAKLQPVVAAAMPDVGNDGLTYVIPLRRGTRFAPPVNRELTADDVKYSFERMLRTPIAPGTSFYANIAGASDCVAGKSRHVTGFRVVDPYTIQIDLIEPDPSFLYTLAMEFCGVMPPEWVKKWGKDIGRHPLGSGPFMFKDWRAGVAVTLERNPNYRYAEQVWLDGVRLEAAYSAQRAFMQLQRDETDVVELLQADFVRVRSDPKLSTRMYEVPMIAMNYVTLNAQMKPFDDVRVRQAMNWAIDRDRLARINGNLAHYQIYPPGMPGHDPDAKFYGHDPAKARELLSAAGYPDGFSITYRTPAESDFFDRIAQSIQNDLAEVGVQVKISRMGGNAYWEAMATPKTVAMGVTSWGMDFPDPSDWVKPLFTKAAAVRYGTNNSFWWDPKLEQMLAEAQRTTDPEARIDKFVNMQTFISEQAPIVPLSTSLKAYLTSPAVGGFFVHPVYTFVPASYWRQ